MVETGAPTVTAAGTPLREVASTTSASAEDVEMPAPALAGPAAAVTPFGNGFEHEEERAEPTAKRQKLSTRRVGGEDVTWMSNHMSTLMNRSSNKFSTAWWTVTMILLEMMTMTIWHGRMVCLHRQFQCGCPLGPLVNFTDEMSVIDTEADKIEVQRLLSMSVITTVDGYSGQLDIPLSAKMVCTWRKTTRTETDEQGVTTSQLMRMRPSRLVGRDFSFLEYREDVYSPASSSSVVKLLPALALSDGFVKEGVIATLDVSDAFLQVPQPIPRKISLDGCEYIVLKCLPGQRDASRLRYSYFVERLRAHVSVDVCPEQPCILRCGADDNLRGVLLLHVDDVLIHGTEKWISEVLIPSLEKEFKLTYPCCRVSLTAKVGVAMYLAQERFDLQFATKTLAGFLQQPTKSAWNALGRLVGYLRFSEDFGLKMEQSKRGSTCMEALLNQYHGKEKNTIEIYSDSEWSGSGDMKSASSAVRVLKGIIIHSTSRSQKCISLSSTEAEWYAASSRVWDAYYLQHIVEFITS